MQKKYSMKNKNFIGSNKKSESAKEIFKIKEV